MRISLKPLVAGAAGLALLAAVACDAATQAQLQGVLQNVDTVSGDVTVKLNDGSVIHMNLKDVKVEVLSAALGSASLEPGANVTIEMDGQQRVKKVKAHAVEVDGVIESLDAAKGEITVDSGGEEITLQVTPSTKIEIEDDDDSGAFADLTVGQEVEVKYLAGTTTALKIEAEDEGEGEDDDDGAEREVHGTVTGVNKDTREVTIRGRNGVEATYRVMPSTKLESHGRATFDVIKTGMEVEAKFHPMTKELMQLQAED